MKEKNYITKKAYFQNNQKKGRTTQLIEKRSGKIIFEVMGISTKKDIIKTIQYINKFN